MDCDMHFKDFPFDVQYCPLIVGTYGSSAWEVTNLEREGQFTEFQTGVHSSTYRIESATRDNSRVGARAVCFATWGNRSWIDIQGGVVFSRFSDGWISRAIIPANFIMALAVMGFFVPPAAAPARVALGAITVLTMTNLKSSFAANLPDIAYSTWLDNYMNAYIVLCVVALLQYAVVSLLMQRHNAKVAQKKKAEEAASTVKPFAEASAIPGLLAPTFSPAAFLPQVPGLTRDGTTQEVQLNIPTVAPVQPAPAPEKTVPRWKKLCCCQPLIDDGMPLYVAFDFHSRWLFVLMALIITGVMMGQAGKGTSYEEPSVSFRK